jgi:peptidoglycan-associated lipoprotein
MLRRQFGFMACSILVVLAMTAACAKRPVTTQAAAPAPSGVAAPGPAPTPPPATPAPPPAPPPAAEAPVAPAPAAPRPAAPAQFAETPGLRDIHFDFDKFIIRPDAGKTLDANVTWLKANPNALILIEGHCDERGTNEYNLALGERRAAATRDYLVAQGIRYGEERPVCQQRNESCWMKNRRAHFLSRSQ